MSPDQLFSITNTAAVLCWILLALLPTRRWVTHVVTGTLAPALFAAAYVAIVVTVMPHADGSFSTLAGVSALAASSMREWSASPSKTSTEAIIFRCCRMGSGRPRASRA